MERCDLTYRVAYDIPPTKTMLSTFYKGSYIGKSVGYWSYDHKTVNIYPYQIIGRHPELDLKTTRFRHEIDY